MVVEYGVDVEESYSLSDYYINEMEKLSAEEQLISFYVDVLKHYVSLVQKERVQAYSLPVTRSIRYIKKHLYEPIQVKTIAAHLHLHPNYLSSLFKKETGTELSEYIHRQKAEEACWLLLQTDHSMLEISEMLGYRSQAHFSSSFKKRFHLSPTQYVRSNRVT